MVSTGESIEQLAVKDLRESPFNLRKTFDATSLAELTRSIQEQGIIQPLIARPLNDGLAYEIVAGARRFRAAKLAGLKTVPCLVRNLSDEQARTEQILENLQRQDVTALEEASGFQELLKTAKGFTVEDGQKNTGAVVALAQSIGKSKEYVYARLKLLKLDPAVQKSLADGKLNASQAVELVPLFPAQQNEMLKHIENQFGGLSTVQDIRDEIKYRFAPKPKAPAPPPAQKTKLAKKLAADRARWQAEEQKRDRARRVHVAALRIAAPAAWKKLARLTRAETNWYLRRVLEQAAEEFPMVPEALGVSEGKPFAEISRFVSKRDKKIARASATGKIVPLLALSCILHDLSWHATPEGVACLKRAGVSWKDCQKRAAAELAAADQAAAGKAAARPVQTSTKAKPRPAARKRASKKGR